MVNAGISYLLLACVMALIRSFIDGLTKAANLVAIEITKGDLLKFSGWTDSEGVTHAGNLLKIFDDFFINNKMTFGVNIAQYIMVFAYVLVILFTIFEVINSMTASLEGESAQHPAKVLLRGIVTILLLIIFFGVPFGTNGTIGDGEWFTYARHGILYSFGELGAEFLHMITNDSLTSGTWSLGLGLKISASLQLPELIVLIILSLGVFKGTIQAAVVFVERYLTFAFYVLIGPIAISTNASKSTERTYHDWLIGLLSNYITLAITLIAFKMYMSIQGAGFLELGGALSSLIGDQTNRVLLSYVISLALLGLISNSEKIVNAIGLKTIANGDSARKYAAGAMVASRAFMMTGGRAMSSAFNGIMHKAEHLNSQYIAKNKPFGLSPDKGLGKMFTEMDHYKSGSRTIGSDGNKVAQRATLQNGKMVANENPNTLIQKADNYTTRKQINESLDNYNRDTSQVGHYVDMRSANLAQGTDRLSNLETKPQGITLANEDGDKIVTFKEREQILNGSKIEGLGFYSHDSNIKAGDIIYDEYGHGDYRVRDVVTETASGSCVYGHLERMPVINEDQFKAHYDTGEYIDSKSFNNQMVERQNQFESTLNEGEYFSTVESSGKVREFFEENHSSELEYESFQHYNTPETKGILSDMADYAEEQRNINVENDVIYTTTGRENNSQAFNNVENNDINEATKYETHTHAINNEYINNNEAYEQEREAELIANMIQESDD